MIQLFLMCHTYHFVFCIIAANYTPSKMIQDTTVKSAQEVSLNTHIVEITDLGSLIGNFESGYSSVELSNFPTTQILRENYFG